MRKNYHREAIDILSNPQALEKDAMLWWIAKAHPSVFVWAAKMTAKRDSGGEVIDRLVLDHIKSGQHLSAIKRYREIHPECLLVDAKGYCDTLKKSLGF